MRYRLLHRQDGQERSMEEKKSFVGMRNRLTTLVDQIRASYDLPLTDTGYKVALRQVNSLWSEQRFPGHGTFVVHLENSTIRVDAIG